MSHGLEIHSYAVFADNSLLGGMLFHLMKKQSSLSGHQMTALNTINGGRNRYGKENFVL